jgi:polyphosphate kinase
MIEKDTLEFLDKMKIDSTDSIIPGGRYHNRRDYMGLGRLDLLYTKNDPLPIPGLRKEVYYRKLAKRIIY